jgi:hypothetical protein
MENVDPMDNVDSRLFGVKYNSPENIAYLVAMLEQVWGVERIHTLMLAVRDIRISQEIEIIHNQEI